MSRTAEDHRHLQQAGALCSVMRLDHSSSCIITWVQRVSTGRVEHLQACITLTVIGILLLKFEHKLLDEEFHNIFPTLVRLVHVHNKVWPLHGG